MPLRQWIKSANNAIEGILYASKTQRHLRYHFYAAIFVLVLSYVIGVTKVEFLFISLAVMAVLLAEMINTAIEFTVDLLSPEYEERARAAKDVAAGAVLITAFAAAVLGYIILFPYFERMCAEGVYFTRHSRAEVSVLIFIVVMIVVVLLKAYFGKGHPLSGGMPSGHSALSFSVWVAVTYTTENILASVLCFVLALLVAQSRVATKVHTPVEVLAGGLLGSLLSYIMFKLLAV